MHDDQRLRQGREGNPKISFGFTLGEDHLQLHLSFLQPALGGLPAQGGLLDALFLDGVNDILPAVDGLTPYRKDTVSRLQAEGGRRSMGQNPSDHRR